MTIWTSQRERIPRKLAMLWRKKHLRKPLIMQISQLESYVTHLNGAISPHPD